MLLEGGYNVLWLEIVCSVGDSMITFCTWLDLQIVVMSDVVTLDFQIQLIN